ncbi:hypothetical protein [Glycomyces sp. NPDC047010]|uniref:hypothetical protein n=1 Tax=Glycomyces sp. NPDC047010 TaxID=3155023 RepID=UPI0033D24294
MSDGVVDLTGAPQHTGFGEGTGEAAEDTSGDFFASLGKAAQGLPIVSHGFNIDKICHTAGEPLDRLFDGDASMDDLLVLAQQVVAIEQELIAFIEERLAFRTGQVDLGYLTGALTKLGLDFLLGVCQPFQDAVGFILGNPERIKVSSAMWSTAKDSLGTVNEHLGSTTVDRLAPNWSGLARDAAVQRLGELQGAVQTAAGLSFLISTLMDLTSGFAEALNNRAKSFVADLLSGLVNALLFLLSPDPFVKVDAILGAVLMIVKLTLEAVNLALQAARMYLAASALLDALAAQFTETVALLDAMSADPC